MTAPFFSDSEIAEMRNIAASTLQTQVQVLRRVVSAGATSATDYGDDEVTYSRTTESRNYKVMGWFYSTPTPVQDENSGQVVTVNTYRLNVPVGTDILPGDEVVVGADHYIVSDTTEERTWAVMLVVSLRLPE
jgi:hypothetical protein